MKYADKETYFGPINEVYLSPGSNFESMRSFALLLIFQCFFAPDLRPQGIQPIGNWTDHLSYQQATAVADLGDQLVVGTPNSIFFLRKNDRSIERQSKLTGLSETGIASLNGNNQVVVIGYHSGNIDLVKQGKVINLPAIKNSQSFPDKTIYEIDLFGSTAYLCTAFGIVAVDTDKEEIIATYIIGANGTTVPVYSLCRIHNNFYAVCSEGLRWADATRGNLQDFNTWKLLKADLLPAASGTYQALSFNDSLLFRKKDSVFQFAGGEFLNFYTSPWNIKKIKPFESRMASLETMNGTARVRFIDASGNISSTLTDPLIRKPLDLTGTGMETYIADSASGLIAYNGSDFELVNPSSPATSTISQVIANAEEVWTVGGTILPTNRGAGVDATIAHFKGREWMNLTADNTPALQPVRDLVTVFADPKTGSAWFGSFGDGLLQWLPDGRFIQYRQNSFIAPAYFDTSSYRVGGLAIDVSGNLWIANDGANQNLVALKPSGTAIKFQPPFNIPGNGLHTIVIDDSQQKWLVVPGSNGLLCFNSGPDLENTADDQWRWFLSGAGAGNLPTNEVLSLAKDRNNFIWVGTSSGIGIIECAEQVFSNQGCEATLPVVQQGNFAGYLFRGERVQAIAVDGANRKWIGTTHGVWLISEDGEKTLLRFNVDNSPLPDNDIRSIAIDPKTGEVYIATSKGLCSYRGTATEASPEKNNILVFPNPVPPGYTGTIAFRGVPDNAIVKITEMDGRLVYQMRANGGQATWNGLDVKGRRVSTGVYLVLISSRDRTESLATKIIFIKK